MFTASGIDDDLMVIEDLGKATHKEDPFDPGDEIDELIKQFTYDGKTSKSKDNECDASSSENFWHDKLTLEKKKLQKDIAELKKKTLQKDRTLEQRERCLSKYMKYLESSKKEIENLKDKISSDEKKIYEMENEIFKLKGLNDQYLRFKLQQEEDEPQIPALKKEIERLRDCLYMKHYRAIKTPGPGRPRKPINLDSLLDNGLDAHLYTVLEYLTKFGVLLNENGLLTRKMKLHLLRDFEGVKGMYGVVGLRIFKSIKEILQPIEETGTKEVPVLSLSDEDEQMVDVATQCSGLCEFGNRAKYRFDATKCNPNDQLKRGRNFTLESDKRKGEVSPDLCIKRQKLNEAASIPSEVSSSKPQSTVSKELDKDLTTAKSASNAGPSQDDAYGSCSQPSSNGSKPKTASSHRHPIGSATLNLITTTFKAIPKGNSRAPKTVTRYGKELVSKVFQYNKFLQSPKYPVQNADKTVKDYLKEADFPKRLHHLTEFINSLDPSLSEYTWIKLTVQSLSKILFNFNLVPDRKRLLLYVFRYVYTSAVSSDQNSGSLISLCRNEKAVVTSLYEVEAKKRIYLKDLLPLAVKSLHELIVSKSSLHLWGLCAWCKLFTELCRVGNLPQKPVLLAADLLVTKNRVAPVMIACMVGVWSKPFEVTETTPDDEKCLQCAISYGVSKSQCDTPYFDETMKEVLSKHICPVPDNPVGLKVVEYLTAKIHLECVKESPLDIQHTDIKWLMAPVVIFSGYSDWDWTQKNILDKYIIPSLSKYEQEGNEAAFELFCCFYAEIFSFFPEKSPDMLVESYRKKVVEGKSFVKDCAAVALIRLLVSQDKAVVGNILDWIEGNCENSRALSLRPLLRKKMLSITTLTLKDIILVD